MVDLTYKIHGKDFELWNYLKSPKAFFCPGLHRPEGGAGKTEQDFEAAHVAPTAANLQPVHLIVAQSDEALCQSGQGGKHLWCTAGNHRMRGSQQGMGTAFLIKKQTGDIDASILTDHMMLPGNRTGPRKRLGLLFQAGCFEQRV